MKTVDLPSSAAVDDLSVAIDRARQITLTKNTPSASGPGIDDALAKAAGLSESNLILQAGPRTRSPSERYAAAYWLEATVSDDEHLKDLYWLAIQEARDESCDYRSAVYNAIYRAERSQTKGSGD